jgi:hypothetical protein
MSNNPVIQDSHKLTVLCRIEPGCLGPNGVDLIDDFCRYAQSRVQSMNAAYVIWKLVARHDKTLPEMHYSISGKNLDHARAERYLAHFNQPLADFEDHFHNRLADLIDDYLQIQSSSGAL